MRNGSILAGPADGTRTCKIVAERAGEQAQHSRSSVVNGSAEATSAGSPISGDDAIAQDHGTEVTEPAAILEASDLNGQAGNAGRKTGSQIEHAVSQVAVHRETRRTGPGNVQAVGDEQGPAGQGHRSVGGEGDGIARLRIGDDLPQGTWPAVGWSERTDPF